MSPVASCWSSSALGFFTVVESHVDHSQPVLNHPSLAGDAWVVFGSSLVWEWVWSHQCTWSGLISWSLRVCSAGHTRHTSPKTKCPLCDPTPWLVPYTCSLTHHNGALLWEALPLVRTETDHSCGSWKGSSGVSATSFTTEQVFKADAANVIAPFLTASALQTMLCNTGIVSMGLLRHEAVHPFFLYFKL